MLVQMPGPVVSTITLPASPLPLGKCLFIEVPWGIVRSQCYQLSVHHLTLGITDFRQFVQIPHHPMLVYLHLPHELDPGSRTFTANLYHIHLSWIQGVLSSLNQHITHLNQVPEVSPLMRPTPLVLGVPHFFLASHPPPSPSYRPNLILFYPT